MVQRHIKSLLYEYDCVIIPDFGGLITHYAPAKIHPVKHTFSPPSKRLAFNEQLKVNDGLLITTLAHQQQCPLSQAQQAVADFVMDLKAQLKAHHQFELTDVGVFRYNAERKLVFESIDSDNFLEHSFGLPEIVAKPITGKETLVLRGNYQDQVSSQDGSAPKLSQRLRRLYRIGSSLVLGGLTASALYLFSMQTDVALSSLNPFSLLSTSEVALANPATKQPISEPASVHPEVDAFDQAYAKEQSKQNVVSESASINTVPEKEPKAPSQVGVVNAPESAKASVVPDLTEESPVVKNETVKATAAKETLAEASKVKDTEVAAATSAKYIIKGKTGRYYVIMGVFEKAPYAKLNQKKLRKEGFIAKTLVPSRASRLYKVSVADFATADEAQIALNSLREKTGQDLWVLNY